MGPMSTQRDFQAPRFFKRVASHGGGRRIAPQPVIARSFRRAWIRRRKRVTRLGDFHVHARAQDRLAAALTLRA
jgi:hypothetical protein